MKKGMSLVTLLFWVILIILVIYGVNIYIAKEKAVETVGDFNSNIELLNMQQIANMTYSKIYFSNLSKGIRRELTAKEIREKMIQDGVDKEQLKNYIITVENGDVFVALKEAK